MRSLIAVVVLLLTAFCDVTLAGDPPGGKGWYQLEPAGRFLSVKFKDGSTLVIAWGTPGFFIGVAKDGRFSIRFERGIFTTKTGAGREVTADGGFEDVLTIDVEPSDVRALLRQPLSKATPGPDGAPSPTRGGGSASGGGLAGLGGGQSITSATLTRTTVTVEDVEERRAAAPPAVSEARESVRRGVQIFPPSAAGPVSGSGKSTRVIALEEHEAWLKKVLRLLDEDGARCETKAYGPGWISICDPVPFRG